jgi:hypothetical protein
MPTVPIHSVANMDILSGAEQTAASGTARTGRPRYLGTDPSN